jgi:hypothetical protein
LEFYNCLPGDSLRKTRVSENVIPVVFQNYMNIVTFKPMLHFYEPWKNLIF